MTKRNGVISYSLFLLLTITFDNTAAKSAEVSAISLDVLRVKACAAGQGCSTVGGPKQWNLFDLAEGKTDFANQVLMPAKTHELRLMLGSKSTITVDGQTYPLIVPSGQVSGLKLKGNKVFASASGFLKSIRLDFDLAKGLVVQAKKVKGKGKKDKDTLVYSYSLKPVIQVSSAEVTPMPENMAAVVALPEKDVTLKFGNNFSMLIPAGAVLDPVVIYTENVKNAIYELNPDGTRFARPVTIAIKYNPALLEGTGYDENDLSILRNGISFPSWMDIELNSITTYTISLSTYEVGINSSHQDFDSNNLIGGNDINSLDQSLRKCLSRMYEDLEKENRLEGSVTISTCRTPKEAHRFSTASNIYNKCIDIKDLQEWGNESGGIDIDTNIWYRKAWEIDARKICSEIDEESCEEKFLLYFAMEQAKKNVENDRIVNRSGCLLGYCRNYTINYAEEGYEKYSKERKPNNNDIKVSNHVKNEIYCKAFDFKGVKWSSFSDNDEPWWSREAEDFISAHHLYRPYTTENVDLVLRDGILNYHQIIVMEIATKKIIHQAHLS